MTLAEEIVALGAILRLAAQLPEVAALFDVERVWMRYEALVGALLGGARVLHRPGAFAGSSTIHRRDLATLERMWARSS